MGTANDQEKESIVQEFCDLETVLEVGFKCKQKTKAALVGSVRPFV